MVQNPSTGAAVEDPSSVPASALAGFYAHLKPLVFTNAALTCTHTPPNTYIIKQ